MKTNIDLHDLTGKFSANISVVLLAALIVLVLAEGLVVKRSVTLLLSAGQTPTIPQNTSVRVNFGLYDEVSKRLEQQSAFKPTAVTAKNPFGILSEEGTASSTKKKTP